MSHPASSGVDRVNRVLGLLGGNAILLYIPAGVKKPVDEGWSEFGPEVMEDQAYLARFGNGGNVGVCLGKQSGGLCTIDIDDDQYIELFLEANPVLRGTLRTKRLKGCNFWMWVEGEYPRVTPLKHARLKKVVEVKGRKKEVPAPIGEWRGTGGQTVIEGQADGIPYTCLVNAKPIHIHFVDIKWPDWILEPPILEEPFENEVKSGNSLDRDKLENVREYASGLIKAACPACRDEGEDKSGDHLQIRPNGKYGCCKYPRDREHRKKIWALAGIPKPKRDERDVPEWIDRYFGEESDKPLDPLTILTFDEIELLSEDPNDLILGDNLLNKGSQLVIAGQGGVGKSRIIIQMIAAMKMGLLKFLNLDIHPGSKSLKWLIIQTENGRRRLKKERERLKRMMSEEQWVEFNADVHVLCPAEPHDTMLGLDNPQAIKRIEMAMQKFKPDAVACDPLGDFSVGDLNKDVDMRRTIVTLWNCVRKENPKRCLVIAHHAITGEAGIVKAVGYDRASFARNSKALFNWTRAQINVVPINPDNSDQLGITCAKCSDGKEFPPFAVKLNLETMIYECDPDIDVTQWAEDLKKGKKGAPIISSEKVRELCELAGSSKSELAKLIIEESGCLRPNAYRYMKAAEVDGQIKWSVERKLFFKN